MPTKLIGSLPNQAPRNADLGTVAFMDADQVNIGGGTITLAASATQGYFQNTDISDVKPSLLLDFANGKTLDPRITFTRSTTATYYDGKTVAKAEENLFAYSNYFMYSAWNKQNITVVDTASIAPDGTPSAWKIVESATNDYHGLTGGTAINPALGSTVTVSIYAKAGERTFIQLSNPSYATFCVIVNLSTGAVAYNMNNVATVVVTSVGNSWYRIAATYVETNSFGYSFGPAPSGSVTSNYVPFYTGNGTSGVYVWGAQFEVRSGATAYTPTTSNPVTNYIPRLQTAQANVARFDHDPITGESKGLLTEESRTNNLTYSQDFSNAAWNKTYGANVINNATIAPDGSLTAAKLYPNATNSYHFLAGMPASSMSGVTNTLTVYAKAGEYRYISLAERSAAGAQATFDLVNGTVVSQSAVVTSATISAVGNGWYRCGVTLSTRADICIHPFPFAPVGNPGTAPNYQGDGYSGIYIWGVQLEAAPFATSYIPTTSSQVTRATDTVEISGNNFYSWYNSTGGVVYLEMAPTVAATNDMWTFNFSGIGSESIQHYQIRNSTAAYVYVYNGATTTAAISVGSTFTVGTARKYVIAFTENDFAYIEGGIVRGTDTSGTLPLYLNKLSFGQLSGHYKKIVYYPKRLSNAELQEMTL